MYALGPHLWELFAALFLGRKKYDRFWGRHPAHREAAVISGIPITNRKSYERSKVAARRVLREQGYTPDEATYRLESAPYQERFDLMMPQIA